MTLRNIAIIENKRNLLLMAALIPSLAAVGLLSSSIPNAEATQCGNPHCYADQRTYISTLSGEKHTEVVTDLTTSTTCPFNAEFITEEGWIVFANNDWLESGFVQGWLQGICRTSEHNYYAYSIGGSYHEFDSGSVSIGTTQNYEMSDRNPSLTKIWHVYINGVDQAQLTMTSATASYIQEGEETSYNSSTAPKTSYTSIQKFSGSTPSWSTLTSGANPWQDDTSFGLWINNCSPNFTHITTGMGGTASC